MARHGRVISFNGEIFNFAAVRAELESGGVAFATRSDTEVLLAGWRRWGPALLPRLVGMFAFALWDPEAGELVLARDRFGEKPLLYAEAPRGLAFGSDLLALEAMLGETRPVDPAGLRWMMALRFLPDSATIARGVARLGAGHLLRFSAAGIAVERWYDLAAARPARWTDEAAAAASLVEAFDRAIADRLVADVPVGCFLSGGLDSSIVAASVARTGARLATFTVGFEGAGAYYEERPLAAAVARHLGATHTEIEVAAASVPGCLERVAAGLDEPLADSSTVPTVLVSEATRRHVTVALSGDGADEAFAGYRRYWGELYAPAWSRLPAWLRDGLIGAALRRLPEGKDSAALEALRRLRRFAAHASGSEVARQAGWTRELDDGELDMLLPGSRAAGVDPEGLIAALREAARDDDPINRTLACDLALGLPGDMLVKVDRMSMANGLEVRAPFLDQRVVECAAAMPGAFKLARDGWRPQGKRILRRAFRDRLPPEVFARPKRGFEMPVAALLRTTLAERLRAAIDPASLRRQGLFDPALPALWREQLESGTRDTSWRLWSLLLFQEWARVHRRPEALA